jgi:hypothetical protein
MEVRKVGWLGHGDMMYGMIVVCTGDVPDA